MSPALSTTLPRSLQQRWNGSSILSVSCRTCFGIFAFAVLDPETASDAVKQVQNDKSENLKIDGGKIFNQKS